MTRTFQVIRGLPGSGKTQWIVEHLLGRLRDGEISAESVLVLAPTSADVRLLSARFDRTALDCGTWFPVRFDTMQGIAGQILTKTPEFAYHRPMDDIEERLVLQAVIERALSDQSTESGNAYREAIRSRSAGFIEDVHAYIAELKQHRIAPQSDHPGSAAFYDEFIGALPQQAELRFLGTVYRMYQEILRDDQRYDAQGILWNAYVATVASGYRISNYSVVFFDDVQDLSALEAELLTRILIPDSELVATYCPETSAFRFRYALRNPVDSLALLLAHTHGNRAEPEIINLTGKEDTRPISLAAMDVQDTGRKETPTILRCCPDVAAERESVAAEIIALLEGRSISLTPTLSRREREKCAPQDIAVITRTHADCQAFSALFHELGIPTSEGAGGAGAGTVMVLLDHVMEFLDSGLQLLKSGSSAPPDSPFARSVFALVSLAGQGAEATTKMMALAEDLKEESIPLAEPAPDRRELVFASKIAGQCERLAELNEALRRIRGGEAISDVLTWLLGIFRLDRFLNEPLLSSAMRALGKALQRIRMAEDTVRRFRGHIHPGIIRLQLPQLIGHSAPPDNRTGVAVIPAHETRGQHWPVVFLPRLNEHVFPADPQISALFREETALALKERTEHLAAQRHLGKGAFSFVGFAEDPRDSREEEDRLFTLAASRASECLLLSWSERDGDREISPSIYVRKTIARLRKQPPQQLDWVEVSETYRYVTPPEAYLFPPVRKDPYPIQVSPESVFDSVLIRHSPSSLSTCWLCPRKYFYQTALQLDRAVTDAQVYGIMVHNILRNLTLDPPQSIQVEDVLKRKDISGIIENNRNRFTSETQFLFYMDRMTSALQDFFDKKGEFFAEPVYVVDGEPVVERRLERTVSLKSGDIILTGKVDVAKDISGKAVAIIDFKTGTPDTEKALRRAMVYREEDTKYTPADRDYQLPLYHFLISPPKETYLCQYHIVPAYGAKKGFTELAFRIIPEGEPEQGELTKKEISTVLDEAFALAIQTEQARSFPREPKNDACRKYGMECPFLFLCDRMNGE
ncbi:MAG TPA: PD-(D/E)XK nuclease family protein [bacterium]|nr:PD-(D/E)XK nuclease family protein [bacterium]